MKNIGVIVTLIGLAIWCFEQQLEIRELNKKTNLLHEHSRLVLQAAEQMNKERKQDLQDFKLKLIQGTE